MKIERMGQVLFLPSSSSCCCWTLAFVFFTASCAFADIKHVEEMTTIKTPLVAFTEKLKKEPLNAQHVHERYITTSPAAGRWGNMVTSFKRLLALGVASGRSVIAPPVRNQPPDQWLDGDYLTKFLHPLRLLYGPTVQQMMMTTTTNGNGTHVVSPVIHKWKKDPDMVAWSNQTLPCVEVAHAHAKMVFNASEEGFTNWKQLTDFLQSPKSPRFVNVCPSSVFFVSGVDAFSPAVPLARPFVDAAEEAFGRIEPFEPMSNPYLSSNLPAKSMTSADTVVQNLPFLRTTDGLPMTNLSLSIHLRRGDRGVLVGSLDTILAIIHECVDKRNVRKLFIATDADATEIAQLRKVLPPQAMVTCTGNQSEMCRDPDNQLMVEQWMCTMTDYFIGSMSSTFTIHIQHIREDYFGRQPKTGVLTRPWGRKENEYSIPAHYPMDKPPPQRKGK